MEPLLPLRSLLLCVKFLTNTKDLTQSREERKERKINFKLMHYQIAGVILA